MAITKAERAALAAELKAEILAELAPAEFVVPEHDTKQITVTCMNAACPHNQRWDDDGNQLFQTSQLEVPVTEGRDDIVWTGVTCGGCRLVLHDPNA